jgi:hypothetical protein
MRIKRLLFLITVPLMLYSCSDDNGSYTQVKQIEHQIYLNIKTYREENGLTGAFAEQYLMVREAQLYSSKMASGLEEVGIQGLDEHYATLSNKFNFYNYNAMVLKTVANNEDQVLTELLLIPGADSTLLEDLTQCGVGVESDTEGFNYVTVLMAKADS